MFTTFSAKVVESSNYVHAPVGNDSVVCTSCYPQEYRTFIN